MTGLHRRKRRPTTTADYTAMLRRMISAYGTRIGQDPADGLAALRELEAALGDAVNLGLHAANRDGGHSITQLADMLGVSKQAISKRISAGTQVQAQRDRLTLTYAAPRQITSAAQPGQAEPGEQHPA